MDDYEAVLVYFDWDYAYFEYVFGDRAELEKMKHDLNGDYDVVHLFVRPTTVEDIDRQFASVDAMMQAMQNHFQAFTIGGEKTDDSQRRRLRRDFASVQ